MSVVTYMENTQGDISLLGISGNVIGVIENIFLLLNQEISNILVYLEKTNEDYIRA